MQARFLLGPAGSGNYTIAAGSSGGPLTFVNGSTVTVATNCFPVISAPVTGTNFIYAGPGALTLSGTNTYTGTTTVTNGTLLVNGSVAAGSTVKVGVGGVLGGSGNNEAITANRVKGIRCALCWNVESARLGRQHNNANVISIGERMVSLETALEIVRVRLETPLEGGRHQRRIDLVDAPQR